jgi:DNA-binding response OmpR family regulator
MNSILIIEDDSSILRGLTDNLSFEGYKVSTSTHGKEGLQKALQEDFDLVLLDIMLPGLNGHEVCRRLKKVKNDLPIIMLTARSSEIDKVTGLDVGADDYITKPFGIPELLARIRALLRRTDKLPVGIDTYSFGDAVLDFKKYIALFKNEEVNLSSKEYAILKFMIDRAGEVIHRYDLLQKVWGYEHVTTTRTVDNYILSIRKKLEDDPSNPKHIISVRGVGYKFEP